MKYLNLYPAIIFLVLCQSMAVQGQTIGEAYLELKNITDPETRIVEELKLTVLGLPREAETNRIKLLEKLQDFATKSPNENLSATFYLSHGHSPKELSRLIDLGEFQSISMLNANFLDGELVTMLGLAGYDRYDGPSEKIIEFLLYKTREMKRIQAEVMESAGMKGPDDLVKIGDIKDVRFYSFQGVLKARNAEAIRAQYGDLLMGVKMINGVHFWP